MQISFESKPQIRDWDFVVLLFYKYVKIENPTEFLENHRALCESLNIKGRFIIAHEGINGTCEGTPEDVNEYVKTVTKDPNFADMHIKYSQGTGTSFPKLKMKVRPEIVSLGLGQDDIDPNQITGTHLKPSELHSWFENKEEFEIIDMRNDYEHAVGHFPNSVLPKLKNFRDLPKEIKNLEHLKDKKILTVCTGGVRCEKASGYLKSQGFKDVYQLDGGMVSYMEQFPGQNFNGAMYSFDGRNVIDYDGKSHEIVGTCRNCGQKTENFTDCKNNSCHGQFLECKDCLIKYGKIYCKDRCDAHLNPFSRLFKRIIRFLA
ncbi:MAG: hypothetical protein JWM20_54 [Patescibacteria group bacterium]|nr:hypothetical protein [Patescibacteria group bacterium]